jgi:hypothetical protein
MRTRKEIAAQIDQMKADKLSFQNFTVQLEITTVELLIDIRDLLANNQQ